MGATSYQRLRGHLAYLGMTAAAEHLAAALDRGLKEKLSATQVLEELLAIQVEETKARRTRGRLRFAHYPVHKTLADFDLDFQPSLDRQQIAELSTLRFVEERRNVLLLGPPGVGKTHLAIALGIAATEAGYRTSFTGALDMAQNLQSAHLAGTAQDKLRSYVGPSVLVIDELGYLPMDQASANWIFQVVSRRDDKGSIILTSNRGFGDGNQVFADQVVASAIVDRLLHRATVLNIKGKSYRMRAYQEQQKREGGGARVREAAAVTWSQFVIGTGHIWRSLTSDVRRFAYYARYSGSPASSTEYRPGQPQRLEISHVHHWFRHRLDLKANWLPCRISTSDDPLWWLPTFAHYSPDLPTRWSTHSEGPVSWICVSAVPFRVAQCAR